MTTGQRRKPGRRPGDDSPGMKIEVAGQTYTVRQSDVSPRLAAALRRETGFAGWLGLAAEARRGFDLDVLAALIWLARQIDGEAVTYDSVLDSLSYDTDLNVSVIDERTPAVKAEGDSPEA